MFCCCCSSTENWLDPLSLGFWDPRPAGWSFEYWLACFFFSSFYNSCHRILLLNKVEFLTYILFRFTSRLYVQLELIIREKGKCTTNLKLIWLWLAWPKMFLVRAFSILIMFSLIVLRFLFRCKSIFKLQQTAGATVDRGQRDLRIPYWVFFRVTL